jgi:hypothetical protein
MTQNVTRAAPSHIHLQRGDERLLRDIDLPVLAHLLLAFVGISSFSLLAVTISDCQRLYILFELCGVYALCNWDRGKA